MAACTHPRSNDELPCPWPDCPAGTPQKTIVLMRGDEGVLRARPQAHLEIAAEEGVELYHRARHADGWAWERQTA
jgi:hypothetical protein